IVQYEWNNGFYARGSFAYLWRGETEAERDYYYNNGSFYTAWMDVPNATNFQVVAGKWFFDHAFHVEALYNATQCLSGDDIRAYNAAQPTNKERKSTRLNSSHVRNAYADFRVKK